jgi:hypothetical protein
VLRERSRLWSSRPAPIMVLASVCDLVLMASLAAAGIFMAPLPIWIIAMLVATIVLPWLWIPSNSSYLHDCASID